MEKEKLNSIVENIQPITLDQMDGVKLMNRIDTKFICAFSQLPAILDELGDGYKVLEIDGCRIHPYKTGYYDTKSFFMYGAHQNGKLNRYKVRKREYVISNQHFLEVKFKNNKGRTIKNRVSRENELSHFSDSESSFLENYTPFESSDLELKMHNNFSRITLVGESERLTIDFDLAFICVGGNEKNYPEIAILELKQGAYTLDSTAMRVLKKHSVRPDSFSKYCVGTASLYSHLKSNRFKDKFVKIDRLKAVHAMNSL